MGLLDGKIALVTGAGGGLGRAHALALAAEGAKVVVNDFGVKRDGSEPGQLPMAEMVAREIVELGGQAMANTDSVTSREGAAAMVELAVSTFGRLDILIANAGILRDKSFKKMTTAMWDSVVDVHLTGTYNCVDAAYQQMLSQQIGGRIVLTSSTSGLFGNFGQCNYGAAKAAIAGFMRCLWPEAQRYGITVNAIAPAAVTRMTEDLTGFAGTDGWGTKMRPEQVSATVTYLCSDAAAEITGRCFLLFGNSVKLIEPQVIDIADSDSTMAWKPEDIGAKILAVVQGRKHPSPL